MRRLAVVLAAALALTACGGSDADTQPAATPPEPAATSTPPTSPESSPEPSPAEPTTAPATTSSAPTTSAPATPTAAPSPSYPADPMEWRLTTGGWGPVRIGQPLPADLNLDVEPAWECIGAIIHTHGEQRVEYWIDPDKGDSITGLYMVGKGVQTRSGVGILTSRADLVATYPNLEPAGTTAEGFEVLALVDSTHTMYFELNLEQVFGIWVQPNEWPVGPPRDRVCGGP